MPARLKHLSYFHVCTTLRRKIPPGVPCLDVCTGMPKDTPNQRPTEQRARLPTGRKLHKAVTPPRTHAAERRRGRRFSPLYVHAKRSEIQRCRDVRACVCAWPVAPSVRAGRQRRRRPVLVGKATPDDPWCLCISNTEKAHPESNNYSSISTQNST